MQGSEKRHIFVSPMCLHGSEDRFYDPEELKVVDILNFGKACNVRGSVRYDPITFTDKKSLLKP